MAIDTLGMKGIGSLHNLRAFEIFGFMAVIASGGGNFASLGLFVTGTAGSRFTSIFRVVVTVPAGNGIPGRIQMHLMVEEHPAGDGMIHHAQRSFGRLGRHRVANNSHRKQSDCQNVSQFQFFLYHFFKRPL
jgi:hypothetical protein